MRLSGFWYRCKLKDVNNSFTHGTNKQIFYKIFYDVKEINEKAIAKLLKEAVNLNYRLKKKSRK